MCPVVRSRKSLIGLRHIYNIIHNTKLNDIHSPGNWEIERQVELCQIVYYRSINTFWQSKYKNRKFIR